MEKGFAQELSFHAVYQEEENMVMRQRVELLLGARFVSAKTDHFRNYYLPLLGQMGFSLLVVTDREEEQQSVMEICEGSTRE